MIARLLFLILLFALSQQARGQQVDVVINQSAFNKFAGAVGNLTGVIPGITIESSFPCLTGSCTKTVFTGELAWELSGARFKVNPQDITFEAGLKGTLKGRNDLGVSVEFGASVNLGASSRISYDRANSQLEVTVDSISASLEFKNILGLAKWSYSLTVPTPNYGFQIPVTQTVLPVTTNSAGTIGVRVKLRDARFELQDGYVRMKADVAIW